MSEVAKLVSKPVKCREGVMTVLENFRLVAEKEGLTGIAIAGVDAEGCTRIAFESGVNLSTLIGAIERMKKRVVDFAEE